MTAELGHRRLKLIYEGVTPRDPQTLRHVTKPHSQQPKLKLQDFGNISFVFTSIAEAKNKKNKQ
jgi:hypothetical protein